jgi:urocanate reductase
MSEISRAVPRGRLVLALALAATMALASSCGASKWKDGSYQGKAEGAHGEVSVQVTVAKGRIAKVEILSQAEEAGVSDLALSRVPEEIVKKQGTDVEAVSGASMTSKGIMAAARDALRKASKE